MYGGLAAEHPRTTAAVDATAGHLRTANGWPAFTEFSASNGGWSAAGGPPYLAANADPWDDHPVHTWSDAIEAAWPAVGRFARLRISTRDGHGEWGGRITAAVLEDTAADGAPTSVAVSGDALRLRLGLRSTWWAADASAILQRWAELGGAGSILGAPTGEEYAVPGGRAQDFAGGVILWSPATGAHEVHGDILARYRALGGPGGFLGLPTSDEGPAGPGG